ncbi:hypothetical protein BT93_D0082 [Corymbia citriodora subsp. variegata]|nr:hypothetical protein BT93_D0082 [Corymbia citriodora subsp. variegata]
MRDLAKREGILPAVWPDVAGDHDERTATLKAVGHAVNVVDSELAPLKGGEFGKDSLLALDLLAVEGHCLLVLVQVHQVRPVRIECPVVVLHEPLGLRHCQIHLLSIDRRQNLALLILCFSHADENPRIYP